MEGEASPDWLRNFKSPTEDAFMILSSSPSSSSREWPEKFSASKDLAEVDPVVDEIGGDSPLVSDLAVKGAGSKGGTVTPKTRGRPPGTGKNQRNKGKSVSAALEEEITLEDGDDDEAEKKVISSRPKRGRKRLLDSDEDDEEFKPPTKSRKTTPSPKVKNKESAKTPKSSRKNKRVSISDDEEIATLKKVKRAIKLESVETAADADDEEDETVPISKLSSVTRTGTQPPVDPSSSDSAAVAQSTVGPPGTDALRALIKDELLEEDGLGVSQKEELLAGDETGEPSERKTKRSLSTLPVMFADKIHRTKVLLECEGDALDLSGDMGAVGRFTVSSGGNDGEDELFLDLKGVVYKTTIVPSNTFFVVNVGQTEAKVEAVMNDFMQLRPDVNQAGDETVVEGTLEGFAFELDNDGDGGAAPNSTPAPVDDDDEDYDEKPKKNSPTKGQGKKVAGTKGGKGKGKAKATGKGGAKKARARAKPAAKKPPKAKPTTPRKPKAAKA